jgi:hypothetical protein
MGRSRRNRQSEENSPVANEENQAEDEVITVDEFGENEEAEDNTGAVELTTDMDESDLPPLTGNGSGGGTTATGRDPMPQERRERISNTLKAHWEGKDGPMKGRTHSDETKAKISASLKASRESGELNDLTPEQRQERAKQRRYAYNKQRNARLRAEKNAAKAAAATSSDQSGDGATESESANQSQDNLVGMVAE